MINKYFIIPVFLISVWQVASAQGLEFHHNSSLSDIADSTTINKLIDSALYYSSNEHSKSLLLLDEAFDRATTINYKQGIGDVYYVRSRVYYYKDNYAASLKNLNKAKSIYQKTESLKGMANYYFDLGRLEALYGDDIKAIQAFQNAMIYEEKRNSIKGKSKILNSLASINSKMKNYNTALNYAKKALVLKKKIGNKIAISNTLTNLGQIYQQMDSLEKAKKYLSGALLIRKKLQDKRRIAGSLYEIAQINNIQNESTKAKEKLLEAYSIFKTLNEKTGQVICLLELSKAYNKLKKTTESKKAIEKAISISKINKNSLLLKDSYKQFADYYSLNKNFKQAFNYFQKYNHLADSLAKVNNARIFNDLEIKYQAEKKDREINLLKKKTEIQYKNNIILILSILILFFVSLLLFIFYRSKSQKLQIKSKLLEKEKIIHNKDLEIKDKETKLLKTELESKNRELTAKVLVMLQTNQMLDNILKKLSALNEKMASNRASSKDISSIIREIENHSGDTLWQDFDKAFKGVHTEFYEKLLKINPNLSSSEIKMASLLKLNLNTKEIADITFKSESSIKSTRFRLRKKLGLDSDKGLVSFLMKL